MEFYDCLTVVEKVEFLVSFQAEVDSRTSTKRDVIDVLPESDVACIRERLSEEQYATLLETTILYPICLRLDAFAVMTASAGGASVTSQQLHARSPQLPDTCLHIQS